MKPQNAKKLRDLRNLEFKQIVELDLKGTVPHEDLMLRWSDTADELIESALNIILKDFASPPKFCVISLGKLGSQELNYSSDVDLLFIYDGDFEVATKIASRLTRLLSDVTEDGFVFRVDLGLRPEGNSGPIVNTIDSLERYYEQRGGEWERQALIRARLSSGDKLLGEEFIKRIQPFVFRKSVDIKILKKIRSTKLSLEREAEAENKYNIKLGAGGIREIEFFVHTLQIINCGRIKELRVANTMAALDRLKKHKIINGKQYTELREIYIFLRRAENIMQGMSDRQIHTLPADKKELEILAKNLNFNSAKLFLNRLKDSMHAVQNHFSRLFEMDFEKSEILEAMEANIETCTNLEEAVDSLPWFKNYTIKRIQELDLGEKLTIEEVSTRLTFLAEVILVEALKIATKKLNKQYTGAKMIIVGMGKFGSQEMDYGSDLDMIFIYLGDDESREYFTRLAQGVISTITMPTRYGRAYSIDTDLRPSGNQGALVSSLSAFERYHKMESQIWERQALVRARVVGGDISLGRRLTSLIEELTYGMPPPPNLRQQVHELRERVIKERASKNYDIKLGKGGIADIETVTQYLQLLHGHRNPGLRVKKTSDALSILATEGFILEEEYKTLAGAYLYYRKLLSRARLMGASLEDDNMLKTREMVREIYEKYLNHPSRSK